MAVATLTSKGQITIPRVSFEPSPRLLDRPQEPPFRL